MVVSWNVFWVLGWQPGVEWGVITQVMKIKDMHLLQLPQFWNWIKIILKHGTFYIHSLQFNS